MLGLRLECYMNEAGGNGDQVLNSMSRDGIPMLESLERKDLKQTAPYESDEKETGEEIVEGLMEITALSLTDVLEDELAYE